MEKYNNSNEEIIISNAKIHRPINITVLENYCLKIDYNDGKSVIFDMKPFLNHPLFRPLKDEKKFNAVKLRGSSICWDGDIDICADSIYRQYLSEN